MTKRILAFDFGASSGRAMISTFENGKLNLKEIHRFSNDPVEVNGTLYWDILRLFFEIKQGIVAAKLDGGFDAIGIDTWGVDFGLLDKNGDLLMNPVHYRDTRTEGLIEEVGKSIPDAELYAETGLQFMSFNTLYQLYYLYKCRPEIMERADKLLFMPDLMSYMLTGEKRAEYTITSTSGLLDQHSDGWNYKLIDRLGFDRKLFPEIVMPGNVYGKLSDKLCKELGVPSVPVIAVCSHDTASAIAAVPTVTDSNMYISSGTWSLMGCENEKPTLTERSMEAGFTNERGYAGTVRYLKNIMGLWLIQECRRQWKREGLDYSFNDIDKLVYDSAPFVAYIDSDDQDFVGMGNMPDRIREYCRKTGQHVPESNGEVARVVYEGLALKYRKTLDLMRSVSGKKIDSINIVGGGCKNFLLCQYAANACNLTVNAGPVEGTVIGNIIVQLMSLGAIEDLKTARKIISESFDMVSYTPENAEQWESAYREYLKVVK